tara:strand:+ start:312 stop:530 length:219 start_codon:yes stop_codon:yes gene_type:complete
MKIQNLNHANVIECRLGGIPAQIAVWRNNEYTVMDSRGYAAPWLERKAGQSAVFEAIQIDAEERFDIYQTKE